MLNLQTLHQNFTDYLWNKVINPNVQPVFRQVAASYIASLVARAKYIYLRWVRLKVNIYIVWANNDKVIIQRVQTTIALQMW